MDISRSEVVEQELNRLIERRYDQRATEERHRPSEELWQESVERYNAERERRLRLQWYEYHQRQAARHRAILEALIASHEDRAAKLLEDQSQGSTEHRDACLHPTRGR